MHVKKVKGCHGLKDIIQFLLVGLEQKEFAPKALGWNSIFHILICEDIK